MAEKLYLGIDESSRLTWVFRSVKDHDPSVCAHGGSNIGILRLISSFVHLPFVVDSLNNIEFDFHNGRLL